MIVVLPCDRTFAKPTLPVVMLILATAGFEDDQLTICVMSWIEPSLNVPVAANCCVSPRGTMGIAGVTVMVTSVAGVTLRLAEPVTEPDAAVICVVPAATVITNPEALMEAIAVLAEPQLTWLVKSCVLPSVKVPVAVNC